jgi:hypothetical protein
MGDGGALMCVTLKVFFVGLDQRKSFLSVFWAKRKEPIVLYCMGSKRDGEIGWILT